MHDDAERLARGLVERIHVDRALGDLDRDRAQERARIEASLDRPLARRDQRSTLDDATTERDTTEVRAAREGERIEHRARGVQPRPARRELALESLDAPLTRHVSRGREPPTDVRARW
ncbi:hypothetical protein [Sandaracinus amylolyticus]|uniref:hypothetical protein n=1 Tax=Sandaracinus amylolyticus TaxID=927083 RepID=UPI001F459DEA|nr:hypothetical protein [Sandaracinus amylolyticus]